MMHVLQHFNSFEFVGCEVHYKVVGRPPASLNSFTGTSVYHLKRAIKLEEELPTAASLLKLSVGKHNEVKKDLDDLQDLVDASGNCDFSTLFERYSISYGNPISVELPGKSHSVTLIPFNHAYLLTVLSSLKLPLLVSGTPISFSNYAYL